MFFLGLLSTPLPYLLLAAFYFFGFAMGMFNNSNGEELAGQVASIAIPAELKQQTPESSTYYYQVNPEVDFKPYTELQLSEKPTSYPPDIRQQVFRDKNSDIPEFLLNSFRFSRPPPSFC